MRSVFCQLKLYFLIFTVAMCACGIKLGIEEMPKILKNKNGAETSAWLKKHGYKFEYVRGVNGGDNGYKLTKNGNRIVFINSNIDTRFDGGQSSIFTGVPLTSISVDNIEIDIYPDFLILYVKGVGKITFSRDSDGDLGSVIWLSL